MSRPITGQLDASGCYRRDRRDGDGPRPHGWAPRSDPVSRAAVSVVCSRLLLGRNRPIAENPALGCPRTSPSAARSSWKRANSPRRDRARRPPRCAIRKAGTVTAQPERDGRRRESTAPLSSARTRRSSAARELFGRILGLDRPAVLGVTAVRQDGAWRRPRPPLAGVTTAEYPWLRGRKGTMQARGQGGPLSF